MGKVITDEARIEEVLNLGVSKVIERDHLKAAMQSGRQLRVKFGIDPTAPNIHLGHAVPLWKLRAFQDLGHKAILIIGDFTARVGDPSGRKEAREPINEVQIKKNMKDYLKQAGMIIDLKKAEVRYNSKWLAKMGLKDIVELLSAVTAAQILKREDFAKRLATDSDIRMLETFYPLLQGYDSVAVKADVEIGGDDQLLNLLMGRKVQRHYKMPEQDILTTFLLVGLDGVKKMSKSIGNIIGVTDASLDMFGKVMSIQDGTINHYFINAAGLPADIAKDMPPRGRKVFLAEKIVARYHGEKEARSAREEWEKIFSKKEMAGKIPILKVSQKISVLDLVLKSKVPTSKSDARRLITQGAVDIDGRVLKDVFKSLNLKGGEVLRVGKKKFFRIKI